MWAMIGRIKTEFFNPYKLRAYLLLKGNIMTNTFVFQSLQIEGLFINQRLETFSNRVFQSLKIEGLFIRL